MFRTSMKNRQRLGGAALCMALFATACGGSPTEDTTSATNEPAATAEPAEASAGGPGLPSLVGPTVAGAQIDTNDLVGQDVIVWFWAPW